MSSRLLLEPFSFGSGSEWEEAKEWFGRKRVDEREIDRVTEESLNVEILGRKSRSVEGGNEANDKSIQNGKR